MLLSKSRRMKKAWALINAVVVLATIAFNYWSNSGGLTGHTVGELSAKYANLFTPAPYAFAIWGLIFLGLLVLAGFQLVWAFTGHVHAVTIIQVGPWLTVANLGNMAWLWAWLHERTGLSVVIMLVVLLALVLIILRTDMERWDAPPGIIVGLWWPVSLYAGWIAVATIADIAAWLTDLGWSALFTPMQWTLVMISVAGLLNLVMVVTRNMREFASVGIWALVAIAVRHWDAMPAIQWTSLAWAALLGAVVAAHAYRNRHLGPFRDRKADVHVL